MKYLLPQAEGTIPFYIWCYFKLKLPYSKGSYKRLQLFNDISWLSFYFIFVQTVISYSNNFVDVWIQAVSLWLVKKVREPNYREPNFFLDVG